MIMNSNKQFSVRHVLLVIGVRKYEQGTDVRAERVVLGLNLPKEND